MTDQRSDAARFRARFDRFAARVRGRLALRLVLNAAAIGVAAGALIAAAAWFCGRPGVRAYAPITAALFAGAALGLARRRRWSDEEVALYLDARLGASEAIATAAGLRRSEIDANARSASGARDAVLTRALAALEDATKPRARRRAWEPALLRRMQLVGPIGAIAAVLIARAPMPLRGASLESKGAAGAHLEQTAGLARAESLRGVTARDAAQRARLDAIARDAERLREQLRAGMARREAQSEVARLEDALAAERLSLGAGDERGGLESALSRLAATNETAAAARDLGDHELEAMDREMQRLANRRESADRARARTAFAEAAAAARAAGAAAVAGALDDEAAQIDRRAARAETLRELSEAMDGAGHAESEALDRDASDAAARTLSRAMADALGKLTPDERRRVAEKLRAMARRGGTSGDAASARELADALSTRERQDRLEARLSEMARETTEPEEAARERALREAEDGARRTERGLRGDGDGEPRSGGPVSAGPGAAIPAPATGGRAGTPGPGGGSTANGSSGAVVQADAMKSRARAPIGNAAAMPGALTTLAPGQAGATANQRGSGDLRTVGPLEVDGVERSDVPEEYREHVRQYFHP